MRRGEPMDHEPRKERRRKRATYERPRILSREKLEVVAVACSPGKAPGQGGECLNFANS